MKIDSKVLKSISGSITLKLLNGIISLLVVPLLLKVLGTDDYALWVTLTALVAWISLFDFGAGFSLKNKVTESVAKNDMSTLYSLVAGTLQFYLLATIVVFIVFVISTFFVKVFSDHLSMVLLIYIPIIIAFPFTLGNFILQGLRKFNILNLLLSLQAFFWLVIISFYKFGEIPVKLPVLAVIYSLLYFVINGIIFIYALKGIDFKWKFILDIQHFLSARKSIFTGLQFFALQVSTLILYSIGNILIYNNLPLKSVAQYDTVNKLFLMGMTLYNVVISVYWSEISHARALNDYISLRKIFRNLLLISSAFSLGTIAVTFAFPLFIKIWTHGMISVELVQFVPFVLLVIVQSFGYSGAVFLNAFENLKGQILFSVLAAILMMPLSNYLFSLNFGISSVPLSSVLLTLPSCIYVLMVTRKSIYNNKVQVQD